MDYLGAPYAISFEAVNGGERVLFPTNILDTIGNLGMRLTDDNTLIIRLETTLPNGKKQQRDFLARTIRDEYVNGVNGGGGGGGISLHVLETELLNYVKTANVINGLDNKGGIDKEGEYKVLDARQGVEIKALLDKLHDGKVDKEQNKGLSTHDFTDELLNKLNGLHNTEIANDLKTDDAGKALSAQQGMALAKHVDNIEEATAAGFKEVKEIIPKVVNDLTTGGDKQALSAEQGKVLDGKIDMMDRAVSPYLDKLNKRILDIGGELSTIEDRLTVSAPTTNSGGVTIIDRLDSNETKQALSANQGKVLAGMIPGIVDDLTTGGTKQALSAEQGKTLALQLEMINRRSLLSIDEVGKRIKEVKDTGDAINKQIKEVKDTGDVLKKDVSTLTGFMERSQNSINNVSLLDARMDDLENKIAKLSNSLTDINTRLENARDTFGNRMFENQ